MSGTVWNTTRFLTDVRRVGQFPSQSTASLDSASILLEADRALMTSLIPLLLRVQEEWLVRRVSITLVNGTAGYAIPRRATGSRVRDVVLVRGTTKTILPRIMPERLADYSTQPTGVPRGFYLDASDIVLVPTPTAADLIQVAIYVRPGRLTTGTAEVPVISAVAADTPSAGRTRVTFTTGGPTLTSPIDIISGYSPFEYKALEIAAANITSTSLDVATSSLLGTPSVGDFVTNQDISPVVQLPVEAWGLLAQRTAQYVMAGLGYMEEAGELERRGDKMERDVTDILTPRTDGSPRRVTGGLLRMMGRSGGW